MTALKKSLDRSLSGASLRPTLKRYILAETAGGEKTRPARRKLSASVAFALITALILAGVAVAAVVIRGFGWFAAQSGSSLAKYKLEQLEQRAEVVNSERIASIKGDAGREIRLEVSRGYYDGSRADVTYSLYAPGRSADTSWRPTEAELTKMEKDAIDGTQWEGFDEQKAAYERDFAETGISGVRIHNYYIVDSAWLPDGQQTYMVNGEEYWEGNKLNGYRSYSELPASARDKSSIQLALMISTYDICYYQDDTGIYFSYQLGQYVKLDPITVVRGKGDTGIRSGTKDFERYAVWAKAEGSPVGTKAAVWQRLPKEWINGNIWERDEDLEKTDFINDYRLLADGVRLEGRMVTEAYASEIIASESFRRGDRQDEIPEVFQSEAPEVLYLMRFEFQGVPEGVKELRLRPVYSLSGERPEEDVVMEILS